MASTSIEATELFVRTIADVAIQNEKYFADLDGVCGDGDFGISLAAGGDGTRSVARFALFGQQRLSGIPSRLFFVENVNGAPALVVDSAPPPGADVAPLVVLTCDVDRRVASRRSTPSPRRRRSPVSPAQKGLASMRYTTRARATVMAQASVRTLLPEPGARVDLRSHPIRPPMTRNSTPDRRSHQV